MYYKPYAVDFADVRERYFHKGYLWRSPETTEVSSYELFIDLLYVGIIGFTGDAAAADANGKSLLRFAITFTLGWKVWSENGQAISWIASDDVIRRLAVLFYLTILLGLTTNMTGYFSSTYKPLIAFYITGRWFGAIYYFSMARLIPMVRPAMICSGVVGFLPGLIWIGSIYVEEPKREALVWIALSLDIFGPAMLVLIERGGSWMGETLNKWCQSTFEFIPGNNIEHRIERTNAFVALVFGYSVVSLLYQSAVPFGINVFFGKAALALIQSFTFNWLYFEVDHFNMHTHAIRRHFLSGWFNFTRNSAAITDVEQPLYGYQSICLSSCHSRYLHPPWRSLLLRMILQGHILTICWIRTPRSRNERLVPDWFGTTVAGLLSRWPAWA
jgi:low temperature requirement protein LtrA